MCISITDYNVLVSWQVFSKSGLKRRLKELSHVQLTSRKELLCNCCQESGNISLKNSFFVDMVVCKYITERWLMSSHVHLSSIADHLNCKLEVVLKSCTIHSPRWALCEAWRYADLTFPAWPTFPAFQDWRSRTTGDSRHTTPCIHRQGPCLWCIWIQGRTEKFYNFNWKWQVVMKFVVPVGLM